MAGVRLNPMQQSHRRQEKEIVSYLESLAK